jgi:hypothetical protein
MSIARFSLGLGFLCMALVAAAGCGGPKHTLIPVDSAILPWQPPEPAEEEAPAEEAPAPSEGAPAPNGK